ncbi:hypothetical protein [Terrarubrum flagellatum]|uniref:hypothetical protein n=1 Tax=Terrirubrum flagellatum TaxID=2895980 RepID=UPI00314510A3
MTTRRPGALSFCFLWSARGLGVALALIALLMGGEAAAQSAANVEITIEGVQVMSIVSPQAILWRNTFHNIYTVAPDGQVSIQDSSVGGPDRLSAGRFGRAGENQSVAGRSLNTLNIRPGNRIEQRSRITTNVGSLIEVQRSIQIRDDSCSVTINYRIRSKDGLAVMRSPDGQNFVFDRYWAEGVTCRIRQL